MCLVENLSKDIFLKIDFLKNFFNSGENVIISTLTFYTLFKPGLTNIAQVYTCVI